MATQNPSKEAIKDTSSSGSTTKAQPPKPPEAVKRDTTAAPGSVPPPIPAAAAAPAAPANVFTATADAAKPSATPVVTRVVADAALEAEIERVKALIKDHDKTKPTPADSMSREQKLALFHKIFEIEGRINQAKLVAEAAGIERTRAVLELISAYNGKLGKWTVDGVGLKARIRGDGAYLMRPDEEEADNI